MPDDVKPVEPTGFPDPTANNEDVARKLTDQNLQKSFTIEDLTDTSKSLDELAAKLEKEKKEGDDGAAPVIEKKPDVTPPADDAEAKKLQEEAARKAEEETAKKAEELKKAETFFKDAPGLPPNASPKSSEAFNTVKIKAAQEISARDAKIEELNKKVTEFETKLKNPVPPELEKEIKELREWRAKIDVDFDPKFKEFDKSINGAREFIYAQLKRSPAVTDTMLAEIKKHGGPDEVKMEKVYQLMNDPTAQRIIESKIADIEMTKFNKEQSIASTKANLSQYLADRSKQFEQSVTAHTTATKQHVDSMLGQLDWFKEKVADAKADEATRKEITEHNAFLAQTQKEVQEALADDSPQMRAVMLVGMAQLFNLQRLHAADKTKLDTLEKSLKEANEKIERYTKPLSSRPRETGASPNGNPAPKKDPDVNQRAGDALDGLMKQVMEQRAAAKV